jgi:SAM-dependent methyltransferase
MAFEQSSSEATAARKSRNADGDYSSAPGVYEGKLAVDLTCGLGVDAFWLSKRFGRVVAVERDPELAAVVRENFRRLGVENVEVVCASAEEFLADVGLADAGLASTDIRADLVYADPDRRDAGGKKMVRMEDCSPDIVALRSQIERIAARLVVKLSPLFDVDEVFRIFGRNADGDIMSTSGTLVEVVSVGGECKEIIADVSFGSSAPPRIRAVAIGLGEAEYALGGDPREADGVDGASCGEVFAPESFASEPLEAFGAFAPERYRYLVIPDVALQKARVARRYFSERGVWMDSDNGYGFAAAEMPDGIMGKVFEIETIEAFDPKELKRRLKAQSIKGIDILKREFPLSAADIARQAGVREGGTAKIAFTRAAGKLWQIAIKSQ